MAENTVLLVKFLKFAISSTYIPYPCWLYPHGRPWALSAATVFSVAEKTGHSVRHGERERRSGGRGKTGPWMVGMVLVE